MTIDTENPYFTVHLAKRRIEELEEELETCRENLEKEKGYNLEIQKKLNLLRDYSVAEQKINKIKSELETALDTIRKLRQSKTAAFQRIEFTEKERDELKQENAHLRADLEEADAKLDALSERDDAVRQLFDALTRLDEWKKKKADVEQMNRNQAERIGELQEENRKLANDAQRLEKERDEILAAIRKEGYNVIDGVMTVRTSPGYGCPSCGHPLNHCLCNGIPKG